MPDIQQFEQGLQATLLSVLRKMPNVTSVYEEASEEPDNGIDFVVNASVNGKPVRLLVQAKSVLFPRTSERRFGT